MDARFPTHRKMPRWMGHPLVVARRKMATAKQRQKQIPVGDDNQKCKCKGNNNGKCNYNNNGKCNYNGKSKSSAWGE